MTFRVKGTLYGDPSGRFGEFVSLRSCKVLTATTVSGPEGHPHAEWADPSPSKTPPPRPSRGIRSDPWEASQG